MVDKAYCQAFKKDWWAYYQAALKETKVRYQRLRESNRYNRELIEAGCHNDKNKINAYYQMCKDAGKNEDALWDFACKTELNIYRMLCAGDFKRAVADGIGEDETEIARQGKEVAREVYRKHQQAIRDAIDKEQTKMLEVVDAVL
jgi:hypothetical protein